jgi:molybdopterin adenylyltransferase
VVGQIVAVCRGKGQAGPKLAGAEGELVAGYGLMGDSHAGHGPCQVRLLARESIDRAFHEHGVLAMPGYFAENLTTEGIDLLALEPGDRLRAGEALLEVVQVGAEPELARTCSFMHVAMLPTEGAFCRVLQGGRVTRGDAIWQPAQ